METAVDKQKSTNNSSNTNDLSNQILGLKKAAAARKGHPKKKKELSNMSIEQQNMTNIDSGVAND